MYIAFDKFNELERPVVTLANPNKTEIGQLGLAHQIRPTMNFNALSELSFQYPYKNTEDGYSPYYDELIEHRLVNLENYGWWIITAVNDTDDGIKKYKEVTAYSLEYELASKKLNLFNGTYKFYDPIAYNNCLLGIVLNGTGWTIDYVDSDLWNKFRTFDVATDTVYSFLMNTASQKYECIFVFDTDNRKVSVYTPNSIVKNTDIFLGYDNVIKQLQVKAVAQELVTAMSVYGDEDLNIALANPLGTVTMYNYDYFKSEKWMSKSLVDKINQWEEDIASESDRYRNALLNLIDKNRSNLDLETALYELESQLKALEDVQALQISGNIPNTDPVAYKNTLNNITSVKSDIRAQKQLINSGNVDASTFKETLTYINDKLKREKYFTAEELKELIPYTLESTYQDDGFIVTDIMTNAEKQQVAIDLYDKGCEVMEKISQPTYEITVDSINYFAIPELKIFGQQTQLGTSLFVEVDRDKFTKCILLSIQFNFDDPTDFNLKLGNRYRLTSAEWTYADLFNESLNTNATVNWSYSGMRQWEGYKDQYTDFVNGALDATKNEIINSTNQEVTMTSSGLRGRKLLDSGEYDDKQWWFANNTLAFTRDNWNSVSLALGEITLPDDAGTMYGLAADAIVGKLLMGSQLVISNETSSFLIDSEGIKVKVGDSNTLTNISASIGSLTSRISDAEGNYTELKQTVDGIDISGMVTFSNLTDGKTQISGSNITTGSINANLITTGKLSANYIDTTDLIASGLIDGADISISDTLIMNSDCSQSVSSIHMYDSTGNYGTIQGGSKTIGFTTATSITFNTPTLKWNGDVLATEDAAYDIAWEIVPSGVDSGSITVVTDYDPSTGTVEYGTLTFTDGWLTKYSA